MDNPKTSWQNTKLDPADRLLRFHRWLQGRLHKMFFFSDDTTKQKKAIGQCKAIILKSVRELNEYGWLLDGVHLAAHIEGKLNTIALQQRLGKVKNLYPYFEKVWGNYVRERADQLREQSKTGGFHIENWSRKFKASESIPALEEKRHQESLREQMAKRKKQQAKTQNDNQQLTLF